MPHAEKAELLGIYKGRVAAGEIKDDPAQRAILRHLDQLTFAIENHRMASKKSALGWMFAKREKQSAPLGLYVHGAVGRGKTMLMDLFFAHLKVRRKRRVHFNDFMADVHERIHAQRQKLARGETRETDPIPPVAAELHEQAWVLCFDEFSVTDITDAMLLSRLFEQLFKLGCVLVATSNVAPDDLYRDGLNRQLFLPFVGLLKNHANVMGLDAPTDYRLEKTARVPVFHQLANGETSSPGLDEAWQLVVDNRVVAPSTIERKGRSIPVPVAVSDAARFAFSDLCDAPLGASDFTAIADRFPIVFIDNVPEIGKGARNQAKRFITLVDVFYDRGIRLFLSASVPIEAIYAGGIGTEKFEFERTVSRLIEMQSADYADAAQSENPE